MTTVVVSSRSFGSGDLDPEQRLRDAGIDVVRIAADHDLEASWEPLAQADGWIAGTGPIGPQELDAASNLRLIARYGVGVDNVDLVAAQQRGVLVTNTPGANSQAVAEHTLALTLAALRHLTVADRAVRQGDWSARRGRELGACQVGIVGLGAIGRAVARLMAAFGAKVVAHDPWLDDEQVWLDTNVPLIDLDELVSSSDVVTLHAPGGGTPLIDTVQLRRFRPHAVLINTARAGLIDQAAVAEALARDELGACAVDVLTGEHGGSSPLLDAPNVIVTPHIAGQTTQAIDRMGMSAAKECIRVLIEGRPPHNPVTARRDR